MEPWHEHALRRIFEADRAVIDEGREPEQFRLYFPDDAPDGMISHRFWDRSWVVPSPATIDGLMRFGVLSVEPTISRARNFSLTAQGRKTAAAKFESAPEPADPEPESAPVSEADGDRRKVALMHGRDIDATRWMRGWLRSVELVPMEWGQLVGSTGKGNPYNGEAVEAAFRDAQAVVVLFTPDEDGSLHPDLGEADDDGPQPRLNVIREPGMALQGHPERTILVQLGSTRTISDLAGRNTVRLDGGPEGLNELANRLKSAGCPVERSGEDWLDTEGLSKLSALRRKGASPVSLGGLDPVVSNGGDFYAVLRARGTAIECRRRDGDGWGDWLPVGAVDENPVDLACASVGPVHAEVFVLLPRGEVKHNWRLRGNWQAYFQSLGRPFGDAAVKRISAGSMRKGHQEVFVESAAGEIAHLWMDGSWHRNADPATALGDGWWRF